MSAPIWLLLLLLACPSVFSYSYNEGVRGTRLLDSRNIDPTAFPIPADNTPLKVEVAVLMTGLVAVNIAQENIKFTAAFFFRWRDLNMAWDLKDANTSFVMRPAKLMWFPQLLLTTSVNDLTMIRPDTRFDQIRVNRDVSVL